MKEEGVIKFNCTWIPRDPVQEDLIKELNSWRDRLYSLGLLGITDDGIGYGNISRRTERNKFIITGSGTGRLQKLNNQHYTLVSAYNFEENTLLAEGPIIASSESLTHAAIYQTRSEANYVMHAHHHDLWKKLLDTVPSTGKNIAYGTTEMAYEIIRLLHENNSPAYRVFAMAGHQDGVIAFGFTAAEAGQALLQFL